MKISILHPSRNRAVRAHACFQEWLFKASGNHDIEWIVSLDSDDSQAEEYRRRFAMAAQVIQHPNRSMVDAVNRAAEASTGDLLIVVSDDFLCPQYWDDRLARFYTDNIELPFGDTEQYAIQVNDDYSYPDRLLTIPILSRPLYNLLGYVYHPGYFSMFADNDLYEVCDRLGCLYRADGLVFEHHHPTRGKNPADATYQRQNSASAWRMGEELFKSRKEAGFPIN